jgi:hypothetical protein
VRRRRRGTPASNTSRAPPGRRGGATLGPRARSCRSRSAPVGWRRARVQNALPLPARPRQRPSSSVGVEEQGSSRVDLSRRPNEAQPPPRPQALL